MPPVVLAPPPRWRGIRKGTTTNSKQRKDTIVALIVLLFGAILLWVLIPTGITASPYGEMDERVGAEYFPSVIAVGIMISGAALLVISLLGREPTEVDGTLPRQVLQGIGLIFAYYLLFRLLGYRVATVLCLAGFFWVFGERRKLVLIVVPLVVAVGFKWIFEGIFNIRLHEGILF